MEIWTYEKKAGAGPQWMAFIYDPELSKYHLPVAFKGGTEQEAHDAAQAEYDKRKERRDLVIANRKEGAAKRAKALQEKAV